MKKKLGDSIPFVSLIAIFVVFIWAETFISSKVLITNGLAPADIFLYRFSLAYLCIWAFSPKKLLCGSLKDELVMLLLGVFGGSLYFLAENTALKLSTASNVAMLVTSAPLMTALVVAVFYREERMNLKQVAGSVIAFVGVALVVLNGKFVLKLNLAGDLLALGAALTWAIYSVLMKLVSERYDVVFITRKVFGYGLLTIVPYFFFVEPLNTSPSILSVTAVWGNLVYLGLVASLLCFLAWNWCLPRLGTVRTTNMIYAQPFFSMLIAHIVLGDRITLMAIIGTIVLTVGMALAVKR